VDIVPKKWDALALWLIIFALALAWRAQNLEAFGLSNDEGAHLMWARLAVEGYPLYSETYAVQAPLFIETVGLAFRLTGNFAVTTGRWAMLLTGFVPLAIGLSWLAHRSGGWPAALTALLLAAMSPLLFTTSRQVMAETPATVLAVISVALLVRYGETEGRGWLFASGLVLGLSFTTKALHPFIVAPAGLLILRPALARRRLSPSLIMHLCAYALGVVAPVAALFILYEPGALYDQLLLFRGDLRAALPGSWPETGTHFTTFVGTHWGLWLLAAGGLMTLTRSLSYFIVHRSSFTIQPSLPLLWVVWLAGGLVMLGWHTPLFPHHFIVLLPPLILLGAECVSAWANKRMGEWRSRDIFPLLLTGAAAFNLPAMIAANQQTAAIVTGGREAEAIKLLGAVSHPNDWMMGDSQFLIFMAGRRTPPLLGDVALVAIKAGRQSSARMIALTEAYQAPAVVSWSLRLPWLPEYLAWVEHHYMARRAWDNDHLIYFAPRFPPGRPIPNERAIRLSEGVTLRGYQLEPEHGVLFLKVYWQTDVPLQEDYTVFTQLLAEDGTLAAGWDSQPLGGHFPTTAWPPGEIVTDLVRLPLPDTLPPGNYHLITGLYRLGTGERLPLADSMGDYITLTRVEIGDR
jgi:hypothetical protein